MSRRLDLSVQYTCGREKIPARAQILLWVKAALALDGEENRRGGKITVRFVDEEEGKSLNAAFRQKDYATNVLSFPYSDPTDQLVCGDLALCVTVVEKEALTQAKPLVAHYAHLIVHGLLHLQGFDHEVGEAAAREMENLESGLLLSLGFEDPYLEEKNQ